jgi:hypothetical protein
VDKQMHKQTKLFLPDIHHKHIKAHLCLFTGKEKTENFQSSKQEDATKNAISETHFICFLNIFKNFFFYSVT